MADKSPETPPENPPSEPTAEEQEAAYWQKFEERLDGWFDRKIQTVRQTSTSRTGRNSLPGILANLVFGEVKKD